MTNSFVLVTVIHYTREVRKRKRKTNKRRYRDRKKEWKIRSHVRNSCVCFFFGRVRTTNWRFDDLLRLYIFVADEKCTLLIFIAHELTNHIMNFLCGLSMEMMQLWFVTFCSKHAVSIHGKSTESDSAMVCLAQGSSLNQCFSFTHSKLHHINCAYFIVNSSCHTFCDVVWPYLRSTARIE